MALQFPDDLMGMSVTVVQMLQQLTTAEIVILADTSYGRWTICHFVLVSVTKFLTFASAYKVDILNYHWKYSMVSATWAFQNKQMVCLPLWLSDIYRQCVLYAVVIVMVSVFWIIVMFNNVHHRV